MQTRQTIYQQLLTVSEQNLSEHRKQITRISVIRFVWFCLLAFLVWISRHLPIYIPVLESIGGIIGFLILIVWYDKHIRQRDYSETRIRLLQKELNLIDYNFEGIDDAREELNGDHPFINDLDVFGGHSLFQYLNRSIAGLGRETLIQWLKDHLTEKAEIVQRQKAVAELSVKQELRLHFFNHRNDTAFFRLKTGRNCRSFLLRKITFREKKYYGDLSD